MNRNILLSIIFIILLLSATTTEAFDGNRKGFVLSGGVGYSKVFNTNAYNNATVLLYGLGYGLDERNTLMYGGNFNMYKINNAGTSSNGYSDFSWYHYYSIKKYSIFSTIGVTKFVMSNIYLGAGFSFTKNIQIGIFYRELFDSDFRDDLKVTITYVAF